MRLYGKEIGGERESVCVSGYSTYMYTCIHVYMKRTRERKREREGPTELRCCHAYGRLFDEDRPREARERETPPEV